MRYLPNSPFRGIIDPDELAENQSVTSREIADNLAGQLFLVDFSESQQTRDQLEHTAAVLKSMAQHQFYWLAQSDRNINYFRDVQLDNIHVGVYVPSDQLLYKCPYFHRTINYGTQLDLLRRLFILGAKPFALADLSAIDDEENYLEMAGSLAHELFPIRNHPMDAEYRKRFAEVKRE